jgi:lipid-binding SYLF domain-containing protein
MKSLRLAGVIAALVFAGGVATMAGDRDPLDVEVGNDIEMFRTTNPGLRQLFDSAYGYAVFPAVSEGAAGVGVAEGRGEVYEKGVVVGTAKLTQVTVGPQLGGQKYAEIILFESPRALSEFKEGKTAFSADASVVDTTASAAAQSRYQHGVIVCTMDRTGLMFQASIGGQHFSFRSVVPDTGNHESPDNAPPPSATPPQQTTPSPSTSPAPTKN